MEKPLTELEIDSLGKDLWGLVLYGRRCTAARLAGLPVPPFEENDANRESQSARPAPISLGAAQRQPEDAPGMLFRRRVMKVGES
jgi:hypothetical protein